MFRFEKLPPLTLYAHIPWCAKKCPYCDFNSHVAADTLPEDTYVDALLADLDRELDDVAGRRIESVFIGGGTPSLFRPASIERLLAGVRTRLALAPDVEVTLEANPGTVEAGRFAELRAAGVNRLSIGVQSFDDGLLARIGRIHDAAEARRAVETAHAAGVDRINLDLMYALPGQTVDGARRDIEEALDLDPSHVSHYQLTLEPGTAFYRRPPARPDDETAWRMQAECQARLASAGYAQYEVSAYARRGARCAHNLNYWTFGDYVGIGAGAHGKLTGAGTITRRSKRRAPASYLGGARRGFVDATRALGPEDAIAEFMLNALRLTGGFPLALFPERTGLDAGSLEPALAEARERGLIEHPVGADGPAVRPTELGRRFLDDLITLFLPEARPDARGAHG